VEVHISLIGRRDLAGEIYRQLRAAILDRRLRCGEALPPTRELAARLSVARTTVSVAYDRLIAEGFATTKVGSGTYVAENLPPPIGMPRRRTVALQPRGVWQNVRIPSELWRPAKYDFRSGLPDARLFPYESWRRLLAREFRDQAGASLYSHPAGHDRLREAIVKHLATSRGIRSEADDVVITSGTQQAIDLIARVLLSPGERVCVEDPSYSTPRRLLAASGFEVCGVPVDSEGLIVDAIPPGTRLVYVSPSHQFPLGMSMSLHRRFALLEWAKRTAGAIVEDDYDSEFRFGGRPIEPVHMLDRDDRVIYVGSFSKTMLPALRLGFVIAPPSLHEALHTAKYLADWNSPLATQAAMARFIEGGFFARHLRRMRRVYEARHRLVVDVLARLFAEELQVVPSSVGLHITALARSASTERIADVVQRASKRGFECTPLSMYAVGEARRAGIVLGYGAIASELIEEGLSVLRRVFAADPHRSAAIGDP
jgi:GntR family transcriptional regulator/MocR family aminotransferase